MKLNDNICATGTRDQGSMKTGLRPRLQEPDHGTQSLLNTFVFRLLGTETLKPFENEYKGEGI